MNSEIQIVILAGGLGTRLRPLTYQFPKSMVPVLEQPFIHYQLDWLAQCGVKDIILSTGYLGEMIQDYVQDGKKWGVRVQFVNEGKDLCGTGGALRLVYDQGLLAEKFLLTYGDSFLPVNASQIFKVFQSRSEPALMSVYKNAGKWDSSNSCFDGHRVTLYDKKVTQPKPEQMHYIDYGLSAFSRSIIGQWISANEKSDLADLFHQLSKRELLAGVEVHERFYEVGSHSGIEDFERYLEYRDRTR